MIRFVAAAASLTATLVVVAPARAQLGVAGRPAITVELAPGVRATAQLRFCGRAPCYVWATEGFSLVGRLQGAGSQTSAVMVDLRGAFALASTRNGRIFASVPRALLSTDDLGATWRNAGLETFQSVLAMAFDRSSDIGVAVGTMGSVWTTPDGGTTWRSRRDGGAESYTGVAIADGAITVVGADGGAWVSFDGGSSIRVLRERGGAVARLVQTRHAVWVGVDGGDWIRVAGGTIERGLALPSSAAPP